MHPTSTGLFDEISRGNANHKHAVTSLSSGAAFSYDANSNMLTRQVGGQSFNLGYNAENRMISVSGAASAAFKHNGDGARVIATEGITTTVFIGNYFEWTGTITDTVKYYYAGTVRVAMCKGAGEPVFLLGDHLGSASVAYDGATESHQGYKPWGETRFVDGILPTQYKFTGQYSQQSIGLYYYGARWYDPFLNRWTSPDPIVPLATQGTQALDRYAYANNNPLRYNDPSGHDVGCSAADPDCLAQNTYTPTPPEYTDWYSGYYSGCLMCHYTTGTQYTRLTNTQLAEADNNARVAAGQATVAAAAGAAIGVGLGVAGAAGAA